MEHDQMYIKQFANCGSTERQRKKKNKDKFDLEVAFYTSFTKC